MGREGEGAGLGGWGRGPEYGECLGVARPRKFLGLWEQAKAQLLWLEIRCPTHKRRASAASHRAAGPVPAAAPTSTTPGHESLCGMVLALQPSHLLCGY